MFVVVSRWPRDRSLDLGTWKAYDFGPNSYLASKVGRLTYVLHLTLYIFKKQVPAFRSSTPIIFMASANASRPRSPRRIEGEKREPNVLLKGLSFSSQCDIEHRSSEWFGDRLAKDL